MTKIYAVFPGMGKTYIYENQEKFGVKVADSDSSKFSWVGEPGNLSRNPAFPNNYIEHIKQTIGTVDYIFVSTHKEVLNGLVEAGIDFTIVRPHRRLTIHYLDRYIKRGSPDSFVKLMGSKWDEFMNDLDNIDVVNKITAMEPTDYLIDLIDLTPELLSGTPGIYVVPNVEEVNNIMKSYMCYEKYDGVMSFTYIGDWSKFITTDLVNILGTHKFTFIKFDAEAIRYLQENNIKFRCLVPEKVVSRDHHYMINMKAALGELEVPFITVKSFTEFLQINFPKVGRFKMIINPNNSTHPINTDVINPCMYFGKRELGITSFKSVLGNAKFADRVLYVLDANEVSEKDYCSIGALYAERKMDLAILLVNADNKEERKRIIDNISEYYNHAIVYNEEQAKLFMYDWI